MARVNIYLPEELIKLWNELENKSYWVQEQLRKEAIKKKEEKQ